MNGNNVAYEKLLKPDVKKEEMLIKTTSIDEYINAFPKEARAALKAIRRIIKDCARQAEEKMGYGVPGFWLGGHPLVNYAAFKKHIGFYPTPGGIKAFKQELSVYKTAAGSVQFPLDKPMPLALVKRMVRFRVRENMANSGGKRRRLSFCPKD